MKTIVNKIVKITLIVLILAFLSLVAQADSGSLYTVNSTADTDDGLCESLTAGSDCTLREAINAANGDVGSLDAIGFNIPAATDPGCDMATDVCTIMPVTRIPRITDPVVIDGYTQPGAVPNSNPGGNGLNSALKVVIDGTNLAPLNFSPTRALWISAGSTTVRGLVFNNFPDSGYQFDAAILLDTNGGNVIEGNFIGTNATGTTDQGNRFGIIVRSSGNLIGGTAPAARNVISGNNTAGIWIRDGAGKDNLVQGNLVGTNATGTAALGNGIGCPGCGQSGGITVQSGFNNLIGGTASGAGNVISGNSQGVFIISGSNNLIQGNFIGTDATGSAALGNDGAGIYLRTDSEANTVGGTESGAGNVIAFNGGIGVLVGTNSIGNPILSNAIFGNTGLGISLSPGGNNDQVPPVIRAVVSTCSGTTIIGTFKSVPETTFRLEFFANTDGADPEGEQFVGSEEVITNMGGNTAFVVCLPGDYLGKYMTATATRYEDDEPADTSYFSAAALVEHGG